MTVTYTNIFKTKFLDPFWAILKGEFNVFLSMDKEYVDRGAEWFNLNPLTDESDSMRSGGNHRIYTANLRYYNHNRPERDREWYNFVTPIGERVKRLIGNNTNTSPYYWHDMQLNINYEPERSELEEDKSLAIIEFIISFRIEEVY